jgi:hypothetical protein
MTTYPAREKNSTIAPSQGAVRVSASSFDITIFLFTQNRLQNSLFFSVVLKSLIIILIRANRCDFPVTHPAISKSVSVIGAGFPARLYCRMNNPRSTLQLVF